MIAHINHLLTFVLSVGGIAVFALALFAADVLRLRNARRRRTREKIEKKKGVWIDDLWER